MDQGASLVAILLPLVSFSCFGPKSGLALDGLLLLLLASVVVVGGGGDGRAGGWRRAQHERPGEDQGY